MMTHRKNLLILFLLLLTGTALHAQPFAPKLSVKGYGQVYYEASKAANTFGINKSEISVSSDLTDRWSMGILFQLNGTPMLKELNMSYRFAPELSFRLGQMKTPFGYENQLAPFLNPLSVGGTMPTVYFAGIGMDPLYSGTSGRDIGLELSGDLFDRMLSYKLVVMNGQGMNRLDLGTTKMYGGVLYFRPLGMVTLHASYLGGRMNAMAAGKGIAAGAAYDRQRISGAVEVKTKPVTLTAEYMYGRDSEVRGRGAYLTLVGHLPKRFDLYGAVDYLQADLAASSKLFTGTLGLQQWFAGICRWQLEYRLEAPRGEEHCPLKHSVRTQLQFAI